MADPVGGAAITIAYTFFFGSQNLGAQSFMTGMLALIIFSGLLTAIVIDRPFAGAVKVTPHALARVLEDFGSMPGIMAAASGGALFFCYKWGMEGSVEWFFGPQLVPRDLSKGVTDVRSSPAIRRHQR